MTRLRTQWLHAIRPGWDVCRPKAIFGERRTASRHDDVHLTPSQIYGVLPQQEYMNRTGNKVVLNLSGADNMKHVEPDDFIIHLRSFQGGIEHSSYRGKVSSAYTVFRPISRIDSRFYQWVLKSDGFVQELRATTEQLRDGQSIKFEQFAGIGLPRPPLDEQRLIAAFLDHEVGRIDRVMVARSREQELLAEGMRSAVDELLAPWAEASVPMRYLATKIGSGKTPRGGASAYVDSGVAFLRSQNIHWEGIRLDDVVYIDNATDEEMSSTRVLPLDVLLNITGGSMGRATIAPLGMPRANVSQHVCIVRLRRPEVAELVSAALSTQFVRDQIQVFQVGGNRDGLNFEQVASLRLPLPVDDPVQEAYLAEELRAVERSFRRVAALLRKSADGLSEYRESLISSAVSGGLDVSTLRSGQVPA